ncbi:MAG: D-alanyl-D-alanine carboxypeptidase [Clostridia bacterium]|nr:D-alanyl-D-alanine carboxypeptidase [Clostridia bacterium]
MVRRVFSVCLVLCLSLIMFGRTEATALSAKSAVAINATTGEILFAVNPEQRMSMASTTKIMTALLLAEEADLTQTLVTTKEMVTVEGSSMGLREGDTVSYYALLVGMLLASGNDAANTTAIALSGSIDAFVEKMNAKARQIGMKNTNFVTPSGLDDEAHYSTAYDMALLGAYAMNNPIFSKVAASKTMTVEYGNPPYRRTLTNHNRLLSMYDSAIGVKTGFTKKSGRCLVSAAENENGRVIAVTLNAPDDWNDHIQMLNQGLSTLKMSTLQYQETLQMDIVGGIGDRVSLIVESVTVSLTEDSQRKITQQISLPRFCYAPVQKGATVGEVTYFYENKKIKTAAIKISESVSAQPTAGCFEQFAACFKLLVAQLGV